MDAMVVPTGLRSHWHQAVLLGVRAHWVSRLLQHPVCAMKMQLSLERSLRHQEILGQVTFWSRLEPGA